MTNTKHTPGPWIVSDNQDAILAATKTIIVAKCNAGPIRFQPASDTIAANARLIAAAPKLLEVLKELIKDDVCEEADPYTLLGEARAVIANAEGRII